MITRIAIALLACLAAACGDSTGPGGARSYWLAYIEYDPSRGGSERLVRVRADGTGRTVLFQPPAEYRDLQGILASPDGQSLLVGVWDVVDETTRWLLVPVAGGTPTVIAGPIAARPTSWSPDGQLIAWIVDGQWSRVAVAMPGSDVVTFLSPDSLYLQGAEPQFSPDGQRLLFTATRQGGQSQAYVVDLQGTMTQVTVADSIGPVQWATWSPDGATIAFLRTDVDRQIYGVWLMSANGTSMRELAPGGFNNLWFSPDGLALGAVQASNTGHLAPLVMDAQTGLLTTLQVPQFSSAPPFYRLPWAPDGSSLVITSVGPQGYSAVATVRPGSAFRYVMPDSLAGHTPAWIPGSNDE